ncbi:Ig domain-containing protein [Nonomuraea sp. NPDC000554]|uniref:Ig domain-containing protein n=1 Tax=Nonomuraea sp. NPDC000554 TaxID=3154259 RepID=UPI00332DD372
MVRIRGATAVIAAVIVTCGSAGLPIPAAAAADGVRIGAGYLAIGLSDTGLVTSLVDTRTGADYLAPGKSVPLVSVVADGQRAVPTKVELSQHGKMLTFRTSKATVDVQVVTLPTYSTLEVVGLTPAPGADVQTLLWGPLPTKVTQTVGENVGAVGDDTFRFGLRPLNDKTVGSWPPEYDSYGFGADLTQSGFGSLGTQTEWSVAAKTTWGSILRAYSYDYSKVRVRRNQIPVGPIEGPGGQIIGSKLALFGAAPDLALSVLSQIAQDQSLPYPTIDGQWQKVAQATRQSVLALHDLNGNSLPTAVKFAKQAGIKNLYSVQNAAGPWVTTGHYQFNGDFGGSDAGATQLVADAAKEGVRVGVHTLADFLDPRDPYVSPPPADSRLAVGKTVKLTRPLGRADTTLYADGDSGDVYGKRLRIGDEFVAFTGVTKLSDTEWQFTGVSRGQWGSAAAAYPAGTGATRVIMNGYGGAIGGLPIIDEIAIRLAAMVNTTGIRTISYDGSESLSYTGWDARGFAHLVNAVYRKLDSVDGFITEASNVSGNTWEAQSRLNYGGLGWPDSDYKQISWNNDYYRANFLPPMAGSLPINGNDTELKTETNLARAASLGATFGWYETNLSSLSSGSNTSAILAAIKRWESAVNAGAFTPAQQKLMADLTANWHLEEITAGQAWSLQRLDAAGNPVGEAQAVKAPAPGFTTPRPPNAQLGKLYEAKVTSSTPQTVRYEITSGRLPDGLTLNKDTGAITGIPTQPGARKFTITARNGGALPDAPITYTLTVRNR